ncbi:Eco57I restriction-modification methylase domain-containing protein [Anabaena sp. UHCC 0204]|uniref:Eco57I restriction-modification methylase domain-containing protein n=1 Tax=Anabaena sp. UHCC 0204 TaxID=2590009 RepID=UPI0014474A0A|nr:N-6 DNA methylase [Anabaena sp. UHCC 0204]MTJ06791.1 N-6 DNA methylase [Anabaena sp. UHCC 0204]
MVIDTKYKDKYQTYFTSDQALSSYMASLLKLEINDRLLEPCAGEGHLLEAALNINKNISSLAYELHPEHAKYLKLKFSSSQNVEIRERDTIFCSDLDLCESFGHKFTKILGNPPYGGWQEYERRTDLKRKYPGFYIRETYTVFLLRCLKLLAQKGRLVFIIPDTFLYLHSHTPLRRYILEEFIIESIDVFRSSLFPGISFGYAGLCIICIRSEKPLSSHSFFVRLVDSLGDLKVLTNTPANCKLIIQRNILQSHSLAIPISRNESTFNELSDSKTIIADIADCVTGFYSGNDKRFLYRSSTLIKRSADYLVVNPDDIEPTPSTLKNPLDGINDAKHFIPILKGGGYNFVKPTQWYIDWSKDAVEHYKIDKKARFQNSSYYFKRGIGFPMVTSKLPTAALIEESLFDQSIVGIFPKSSVDLFFLLAYCNSPVFWSCLKAINPSANNSAKYILKTPIILPDEDTLKHISLRTQELVVELMQGSKQPLCEILKQEIIDSITQYVHKKTSHHFIDPM